MGSRSIVCSQICFLPTSISSLISLPCVIVGLDPTQLKWWLAGKGLKVPHASTDCGTREQNSVQSVPPRSLHPVLLSFRATGRPTEWRACATHCPLRSACGTALISGTSGEWTEDGKTNRVQLPQRSTDHPTSANCGSTDDVKKSHAFWVSQYIFRAKSNQSQTPQQLRLCCGAFVEDLYTLPPSPCLSNAVRSPESALLIFSSSSTS